MLMSNTKMHKTLDTLYKYLGATGILGYAVARNIRILESACQEYINIYNAGINKFGEKVTAEDGQEVKYVSEDSDNMKDFIKYIEPYASIEHDVFFFKVKYKDAVNKNVSAEALLDLDFMLED